MNYSNYYMHLIENRKRAQTHYNRVNCYKVQLKINLRRRKEVYNKAKYNVKNRSYSLCQ